jgi:hypothetical protein
MRKRHGMGAPGRHVRRIARERVDDRSIDVNGGCGFGRGQAGDRAM